MRGNYPTYIKNYVKDRLELEDTKEDNAYMDGLSSDAVFKHVLEWNGICGYAESIKIWIKDIYGIDIDAEKIR